MKLCWFLGTFSLLLLFCCLPGTNGQNTVIDPMCSPVEHTGNGCFLLTQQVGSALSLTCTLAVSDAKLVWKRTRRVDNNIEPVVEVLAPPGGGLEGEERFGFSVVSNMTSLGEEISALYKASVGLDDDGNYTCFSSASDSYHYTVNLAVIHITVKQLESQRGAPSVGDDVMLACDVLLNPWTVTQYSLSTVCGWHYGNTQLSPDSRRYDIYPWNAGSLLNIKNSQPQLDTKQPFQCRCVLSAQLFTSTQSQTYTSNTITVNIIGSDQSAQPTSEYLRGSSTSHHRRSRDVINACLSLAAVAVLLFRYVT